ncbi:MAG: hypothetical protein QG553_333 [Patescibacteria group bacterium]|nr:hypothetical protein [Patescibacteria group bacterium]
MVIVIYGTTGELIKILPLLKALPAGSYQTICTYQQPQQLKKLFKSAGVPPPDYKIGLSEDAQDLESIWSIPGWMIKVWFGFFVNRKKIRRALKNSGDTKNLMIVHGDTTTTLFGAIMGRLLHLKVGHIEAGLRSFNWRHPFPEELNRIYTSKIARFHFAPGKTPIKNLKKAAVKGEIVNTKYNTVLDSLRMAKASKVTAQKGLPRTYCVVSIHRNELLTQPKELKAILESVNRFAAKTPIVFLDHPLTKERLHNLKLDPLLKHKNITRLPKLTYFDFINLLGKANCIITDSGGLQEEAAYLGIPCLIHRKATEREEGLGGNVVLSYYEPSKVDEFCDNYKKYQGEGVSHTVSPTAIIIKTLQKESAIQD